MGILTILKIKRPNILKIILNIQVKMRMRLVTKEEKLDHLSQQKCGKHWSGMQMILQHQEWLDNIHLMRIFSIWDYLEKSMGYFFY